MQIKIIPGRCNLFPSQMKNLNRKCAQLVFLFLKSNLSQKRYISGTCLFKHGRSFSGKQSLKCYTRLVFAIHIPYSIAIHFVIHFKHNHSLLFQTRAKNCKK